MTPLFHIPYLIHQEILLVLIACSNTFKIHSESNHVLRLLLLIWSKSYFPSPGFLQCWSLCLHPGPLQSILNMAARVILLEHSSPQRLQWLPISHRIKAKFSQSPARHPPTSHPLRFWPHLPLFCLHSLHRSHTGLLTLPQTCQAGSLLKTSDQLILLPEMFFPQIATWLTSFSSSSFHQMSPSH